MELADIDVGVTATGDKLHILDCNTQGSLCRLKWLDSIEFDGVVTEADERLCKHCIKTYNSQANKE